MKLKAENWLRNWNGIEKIVIIKSDEKMQFGKMVSDSLLGLLFVMSVFACAQEGNMILELKDVRFFKAHDASPVTLKVSGLAFHSSLAVSEITTSQHDESLQLLVHLSPATAGMSGNFAYTLTVPASVNTVSFGKEKVTIWSRTAGIVQTGPP